MIMRKKRNGGSRNMYTYSMAQWILIFFIYCFVGWIWECCFVSIKNRRWENRGFLNGPFIPIYGFGAIIILFLTLPVRDNLYYVFALGMAGATLLELITGYVMERIFQIKYWDYSNMPLNIKGYVCLPATLCWGAFSVILIKYLHKPVEDVVLHVPAGILNVLDVLLLVYFVTDIVCSTQEALDLKRMIQIYVAENPEIRNLKLNLEQSKQKLEDGLELLEDSLEQSKQKLEDGLEQSKQKLEDGLELLEGNLEQSRQKLESGLEQSKQKLEDSLEQLEDSLEQSKLKWKQSRQKLQQETKKRAIRILKRNRGAVYKKRKLDFDEIKNFLDRM